MRSISSVVFFGSSPRVRGKQILGFKDSSQKGLIPACAGKTGPLRRKYRHSGAHPRVCGENKNRSPNTSPHMGSSPRVRGKQSAFRHGTRLTGLIPACAGKTVTRRRPAVCQRAHPRVCGENPLFSLPFLPVSGSSPRVRGKPGLGGHKDFMVGLIPACAGKTIT